MSMADIFYEDSALAFMQRSGNFLLRHEVEHNMLLGLVEAAQHMQSNDTFFATLANSDDVQMVAVQQPGKYLVLSRKGEEADIGELIGACAAIRPSIPGILGPSDAAAIAADLWMEKNGQVIKDHKDMILYTLDKLTIPASEKGKIRVAQGADVALAAKWSMAFAREVLPKNEHPDKKKAEKTAAEKIAAGRIYFWEVDGEPVAQCSFAGTRDVARIGGVYTPPKQREKGYAASLVAHLSQKLLQEKGKKKCCLYADAQNPVSNGIYRKIGYEFTSRSGLYIF